MVWREPPSIDTKSFPEFAQGRQKILPRKPEKGNFTGADFSALTSESYIIAVKEKIEVVWKDIELYKAENGL